MKRIAVLTGGGDAPGMNAAVRAVVRQGDALGLEVYGIRQGLLGIFEDQMGPLTVGDVGSIMERGGTFLQSSRYEPFFQKEVQEDAVKRLRDKDIGGVVLIGGEGSLNAALCLHQLGMPVVGVPSTIDNDIYGTDMAIGVDTALNTIIRAVDRLRDTASSHTRAFVVEVMGRDCGYLALLASIAGGAEAVLVPELEYDLEDLVDRISRGYKRGKKHAIIIVAEGIREKNAGQFVADHLMSTTGLEVRVTVLGHIQRGGTPTSYDRLLAGRLGAAAVEQLHLGLSGVMVAMEAGEVELKTLAQILSQKKTLDPQLVNLARVLSR